MEPYENVSIPPYTTIKFDPPYPNGENGWYVSNVTVRLEADDDTGVNITYYRINEAEWQTYESPFVLSEDGEDILIEYYSVDIDGNVETLKSKRIDIDQTPPEMIVEWDVEKVGWRKWNVEFFITVTDDTSGGGDRLEIFINNELQGTITGPGPYTWSCIISGGLSFSFKFITSDLAGNPVSVVVNSSEINSFTYNQNILTRQSNHLWLLEFFERFPLIQHLFNVLRWYS